MYERELACRCGGIRGRRHRLPVRVGAGGGDARLRQAGAHYVLVRLGGVRTPRGRRTRNRQPAAEQHDGAAWRTPGALAARSRHRLRQPLRRHQMVSNRV